jgi:hypothetical protein
VFIGDHQLMGWKRGAVGANFLSQVPLYGGWIRDRGAVGDALTHNEVLGVATRHSSGSHHLVDPNTNPFNPKTISNNITQNTRQIPRLGSATDKEFNTYF